MSKRVEYDAIIVGAGPNGLAAGIRLAQEKLAVLVLEAGPEAGGATRSAELTLPGFIHDVGSAVHPLGLGSPFFRSLPLQRYGLEWIHPEIPLAHPLPDGAVALLERSLADTAKGLAEDEKAYRQLLSPFVEQWENLSNEFLQPMLHCPSHPLQLARFGIKAIRSAASVAEKTFVGEPAKALFAGLAAHSFLPLEQRGSAAIGLVLAMLGHAVGWPIPRGGSQQIANALVAHLRELGGEIKTNSLVEDLGELPLSRAILLDVTPLQLLLTTGDKLPATYQKRLGKFRHGPGVFKLDYALSKPIPWRDKSSSHAGTVHLGGRFSEIAASEREVAVGKHPEKPFVLLAQLSLFDPSRAPAGKHTAWAYCHVPNGSTFDMTERIENQIERFAPGFRDCILARHTMNCAQMQARNPNLVGGDINGGAADLWQLFARPVLSAAPYRTPIPGLYLCSSSTPPGGGVHGMCGFHAAETALKDLFR